MMGRTDPLIVKEALKNHGIEWDGSRVEAFRRLYFKILAEEIHVPMTKKWLCPGIDRLLPLLASEESLTLGLLTGNWRESAMMKLDYFGIRQYFSDGSFADDSAIREDLVPIAVRRLQPLMPEPPEPSRVYVIGDTPLDVACARPFGARTVAVATGFHSTEELKQASPDRIFEDFSEVRNVLDYFLNS